MFELGAGMIALCVACMLAAFGGGWWGTKRRKQSLSVKEEVITLVQSRADMLRTINKKLDTLHGIWGWWTKRGIVKELERRGLVIKQD